MNRDQLTELLQEARDRDLSSDEIADQILALAETDATWARALSHPLRGAILRMLRRDGTLSPIGAARLLEQPVGTTAYHFRQLYRLGFIEVCDEVQRRGATEHIYRLTPGVGGWASAPKAHA